MNHFVATALVMVLANSGCDVVERPGALSDPSYTGASSSRSSDGNVEIIISNQSTELQDVDITIYVDGIEEISDLFNVGNQHSFVAYTMELRAGVHDVFVESEIGAAETIESFELGDEKRWLLTSFWFSTRPASPSPPKFSFAVLAEEPHFR